MIATGTNMQVLAVAYDLHIPGSRSLKDKRAVLRPLLEGLRSRHHVAVSETDHHDTWQRAGVGMAVVAPTPGHARELIDAADRFVWSFPEIEVLGAHEHWLERD